VAGRRRLSSLPISSTQDKAPTPPAGPEHERERSPSPGPADSSSTTSSEDESSPAQSRIIRRPPRFQQQEEASPYADDETDESEPAFQPYNPPSDSQTSGHDLNSTLRGDDRPGAPRRTARARRQHHPQTSDSDASPAAPASRPSKVREQKAPGPLSPRRTAELSGRSPVGKGSREGSDGTPSMGSSFSDLDGKPRFPTGLRCYAHSTRRRLCDPIRSRRGSSQSHESWCCE
jgi:hypothetical protein